KYIDASANASEEDVLERGKDVIPVYKCPGDRSYTINTLCNQAEFAVEDDRASYDAYGTSFTLNSRWLQGYSKSKCGVSSVLGGGDGATKQAYGTIASASVGGGASQFIQWSELGFYSATQNACEKLEWSEAAPQRMGWHRKFSFWSVAFAD